MPLPSHRITEEIDRLARTYGQPLVVNETLRIRTMFGALDERPARIAEVVPVIMRPSGTVVTLTKQNYPPGIFRLPSGGIRKGEGILAALQRETYEETGLHVTVKRFLAIVRYQVIVAAGRTGRFTSYVFLVEGDGPLQPVDPNEHISEFREIAPADLPALAEALLSLPAGGNSDWSDWGRFRSVVHRVVAEALATKAEPQMNADEHRSKIGTADERG